MGYDLFFFLSTGTMGNYEKGVFICLCWARYPDGEGMMSKKGIGVAERLYSAQAFWFFPSSFVQD